MFFLRNSNKSNGGLSSLFSQPISWSQLQPAVKAGFEIGKTLLNNDLIKEVGSETVDAGIDMIENIANEVLNENKSLQESATTNFKDFKNKLKTSLNKKRKRKLDESEESFTDTKKKRGPFNLLD